MVGQPGFLFMERSNAALHKFVDGSIGAALDVLTNQRFKLGTKADFHVIIPPHTAETAHRDTT